MQEGPEGTGSVLSAVPCIVKPLNLRDRHTEAKISPDCPEGETQAEILGHWQAAFEIQIKEQNYQIHACQTYFLYDLKLITRRFSGSDSQMLEAVLVLILIFLYVANDCYRPGNQGPWESAAYLQLTDSSSTVLMLS